MLDGFDLDCLESSLKVAIPELVRSDNPSYKDFARVRRMIEEVLRSGNPQILDTISRSNHPMIQKMREEI